ncbi:MAG: hypothetical protein A3J97_13210 [Spirochaetes bacterium RIFOXYC1_FULL_54_7]|nr:MAG: hypothetical protein A3J97_13210 [Spirochaetes bacterium RIFOXYC1_FULL_54_7]
MITKKRTPAFPAYVCTKTTQEGDLILIGCKLVQHGRQMILRVWNGNPWLPVFNDLYAEFLAL